MASRRLLLFAVIEDTAIVALEDHLDRAVMGRINIRCPQQASQPASASMGIVVVQFASWTAQGAPGLILQTRIALLAVPI